MDGSKYQYKYIYLGKKCFGLIYSTVQIIYLRYGGKGGSKFITFAMFISLQFNLFHIVQKNPKLDKFEMALSVI